MARKLEDMSLEEQEDIKRTLEKQTEEAKLRELYYSGEDIDLEKDDAIQELNKKALNGEID